MTGLSVALLIKFLERASRWRQEFMVYCMNFYGIWYELQMHPRNTCVHVKHLEKIIFNRPPLEGQVLNRASSLIILFTFH